jgi:hypothetical protein
MFMGKAVYEPATLEGKLRTILEASGGESFTASQLVAKLAQARGEVPADDVRESLWKLYYRGQAEPVQPTSGAVLEQRWKVAERQIDQLKNRQPMWTVSASGSILNHSAGSPGEEIHNRSGNKRR